MRKSIFTGILAFFGLSLVSNGQINTSTTPSLRLKAYEQVFINGVAPSPVIEVGDRETKLPVRPTKPNYYIYLLTNKLSDIKIESIWLRQQSYTATIVRVSSKPVIVGNGKQKDTLIKYSDGDVWQVHIKEPITNGNKLKKDIAHKVAANELVLRLRDKNSAVYTRVVKIFTQLEPAIGM